VTVTTTTTPVLLRHAQAQHLLPSSSLHMFSSLSATSFTEMTVGASIQSSKSNSKSTPPVHHSLTIVERKKRVHMTKSTQGSAELPERWLTHRTVISTAPSRWLQMFTNSFVQSTTLKREKKGKTEVKYGLMAGGGGENSSKP